MTTVVSDVTDRPDTRERIHTVRLLYTVRVQSGILSPEADETTDAVAWHDLAAAANLPLMPFVREMLYGS
ncbi:MAG: hypothetical protein H0V23_04840 [Nocardioidaceae bacterium]|nr:hypothetical protein [Nocardioidaceae bacterium]